MIAKILISLGVLVYMVLIPYLEMNASHVFNPQWPGHARLHEVWQLTTNISLGLVALWLTWKEERIQMAGVISICVMGGVLVAHVTEGFYDGTLLSGNIAKTVLGLELAAFIALVVVLLSIVAMVTERNRALR
ncbi:MAG: hypothetical protein COB09_00960 [Thalassobium sp.]|uniref:Uncharacterized protein n=1 Tax=Thalassolituus pacificus TaxID=2975440 RepID=A0A9X2WIV9_9GAMM|nr:hypothetical protein [Thalassolituus pacificus]MCT7360612.1 hypothetical protein [Thalassolituus pacificus]PHS66069.1 MAG: hypothetical protein COB09_00960 [Thalassobium sp.]